MTLTERDKLMLLLGEITQRVRQSMTSVSWSRDFAISIPESAVQREEPYPSAYWAATLRVPDDPGFSVYHQSVEGLALKFHMDADEIAYAGNSAGPGLFGQTDASCDLIGDHELPVVVDDLLYRASYAGKSAPADSVFPDYILVPPLLYMKCLPLLQSIYERNWLTKFWSRHGFPAYCRPSFEIRPNKWCIGRGEGGTPQVLGTVDRLVAVCSAHVSLPLTYPEVVKVDVGMVDGASAATFRASLEPPRINPEHIAYADIRAE